MTKNDITAMLAVLQTAYPYFYSKKSSEELYTIAQIWEKKFKNEDARIVTLAIDEIIEREEYPPSIAMVKNYIDRLKQYASGADTLSELWDKLVYACGDSIYNSQKAYGNLPRVLQLFVGSPSQLRRYAEFSTAEMEKYVRPELSKALPQLREREKFEQTISPEMKALLADSASNKLLEQSRNSIR